MFKCSKTSLCIVFEQIMHWYKDSAGYDLFLLRCAVLQCHTAVVFPVQIKRQTFENFRTYMLLFNVYTIDNVIVN